MPGSVHVHQSSVQDRLTVYDACFFCLGITSTGKSEAEYTRITKTLTLTAAATLAKLSPRMAFSYMSAMGTDSSETGSILWTRVKGATESALLRVPFRAAYMFRPGGIQPMHGEMPRALPTRIALTLLRPLMPFLIKLVPKHIAQPSASEERC